MPRGGPKYDKDGNLRTGNKPLPFKTVKRMFEISEDQDEFLNTVGSRKRSPYVRAAIEVKRDYDGKIEQIKELKKTWEAAELQYRDMGMVSRAGVVMRNIKGLEEALDILKRPANR